MRGLSLLSLSGRPFAVRIGGNLCHAMGTSAIVKADLEAYQQRAIAMVRDLIETLHRGIASS